MSFDRLFVCCLAFAGVLWGCQSPEEEITSSTATSVPFDGRPDPRFVGDWKSADKSADYLFGADGMYHLNKKVAARQGNFQIKVDARWCLNKAGDRILMEDAAKNVVPYTYQLEGNKLTLALTGSLKNETVLFKQ